ncbi:unnamed protein product [Hydatigera taeniaeformis]|uniref:Secreted protein n=1 Tax=Hydatigena taeniaeformis TaxID=6205 RepID=A0A0R3WW34_HYDTA|nr:unnamed protein product [Hydatigera taeniaeformis]
MLGAEAFCLYLTGSESASGPDTRDTTPPQRGMNEGGEQQTANPRGTLATTHETISRLAASTTHSSLPSSPHLHQVIFAASRLSPTLLPSLDCTRSPP